LLAMAMGRKNLFNDFINGNPKLILTGQNYGIYLRCRRFLTILLANTQTVLLEEPGGWFPNISSSEISPFFCVDKGKVVMYILTSSKYVIFQSQTTRSCVNKIGENWAGFLELNFKEPAFFVDKDKIAMYSLANSKQISFIQSQYPRPRILSRSEKNRAGISELKSGSASFFVF